MPNYISLGRLALLPLLFAFLATGLYSVAVVVAVVVFVSDFVDGYVARRTDTESRLGAWLDPVADRCAGMAVAAGLAVSHAIPWGYLLLLVVPDVVLLLVAVLKFSGSPEVAVTKTGKARTALIFLGLATVMLGMALSEHSTDTMNLVGWGYLTAMIGLAVHYIAGVQYLTAMCHKPRHVSNVTA
ncbi:CDP-alcohol phosphatidyltransferase family protein [Leifsonia sp. ZF2019]|uniref:CDP-alcohol phosphatidyltransferase family protein n=1 Tax=Leifsonia sp. ZF2019 TaxID=2781978 RepID=UPI001CBBA516|nr:CDP-alcohol phosphatidyltransferase family protein [Leifsonia sp. ZF2019]UAJ80121.1 CDP-alcohol phosphatidyltransferase family protein [Leifsonia sp. ZF2019]